MEELVIRSKQEKEVLDITEEVQKLVSEKGVQDGTCNLLVLHTTAALTTADLDNRTDLDILDAIEALAPDLPYRHPHNPEHVKYHIMATIIGPSVTAPIEKGKLVLGAWQRIILIELGGPRERSIAVTFS